MTKRSTWRMAATLGTMLMAGVAPAAAQVAADCTHDGIALWGKVAVTDSHYADLTVRVVDNHADLRVRQVDSWADACGLWEIVDSHYPDFTVRFVDSHYADIAIEWVESHPGVN